MTDENTTTRPAHGKLDAPSTANLKELSSFGDFGTTADVPFLDKLCASLTKEAKQTLGPLIPTATPCGDQGTAGSVLAKNPSLPPAALTCESIAPDHA